ncbi:MAG: helix-turn-helix domain-containing protein, partial [Pseudonocardiaceae bacterium]
GVSQREIARRTGQSQSEVSEIMHRGRQVRDITVLERIADGLGVPRPFLRILADAPGVDGQDGAYGGEVTVAGPPEGVSAEMLRRHVLALGGVAAFGVPVKGLGELLAKLGDPAPLSLPSSLFEVHVAQVRDLTQQLGKAGKTHGSNPVVSSAVAAWGMRLLGVPGPEPLKRELMAAVAELQIHAGWAGSDAGLYRRAMYHYSQALELATEAKDAYPQAHALTLAGFVTVEHGHPNDGLKMLQLAQVTAWGIAADDRRGRAVEAWAQADSATALAALGKPEAAYRAVGKARELWTPTRADPTGDLDYVAACLEVERGRLDVAEQLAAASMRRWQDNSRLGRTRSGIVFATIHVRAGESRGLQLAHSAITAVTKLSSVRARRCLEPLVAALEARPGSDTKELGRMA